MVSCCFLSVFFFKQKTAYEMRISDWSSDVCSSDLSHLDLTPQSSGLFAISLGLSAIFPDEHEMLRHGMTMYDALYAWCRSGQGATHNWPPTTSDGTGRARRRLARFVVCRIKSPRVLPVKAGSCGNFTFTARSEGREGG